jgi:hypothetical protein
MQLLAECISVVFHNHYERDFSIWNEDYENAFSELLVLGYKMWCDKKMVDVK